MIRSKPLIVKDREDGTNSFKPPRNIFKKMWWHVKRFYRRQILHKFERTNYHLSWHKTLKKTYSFDGNYLYIIINHHLKNVQDALINGYAIHDKKDLKALEECIKLSERLFEDKYDEKYHEAHDKKWGELETWTEPCKNNSNFLSWHSKRAKAVTKAQQKKEREEFRKTWEDADKDRQKDVDKFYRLLKKHINNWWD